MDLIIGGAYQGKLDYARETYHLKESDIFTCEGTEIDFSRTAVYGLERFTLACIRAEKDPAQYIKEHEAQWTDSVLICEDIFCGVVPLGAEMRQWRQQTGRLCQYLSGKARRVSRIFCGLEQRLK